MSSRIPSYRVKKDTSSKKKGKQRNNVHASVQKSPKRKKKPFIPPPGKTSPGKNMAWESQSHRLEINPPLGSSQFNIDNLSTSEDDEIRQVSKNYEKKIDQLLEDVSISERQYLKAKTSEQLNASRKLLEEQENELMVSKSERQYLKAKTSEQLNASRKLLEEQENELMLYRRNLDGVTRDNSKLYKSLEHLNKEVEISRTEAGILSTEKEKLLQKLLDIESEGKSAIVELNKLREKCRLLKHDRKLTSVEFSELTSQRDTLLEKLEDFERSNRVLRKLLKEAQHREEISQRNTQRSELLIEKLTLAEAKIQEMDQVNTQRCEMLMEKLAKAEAKIQEMDQKNIQRCEKLKEKLAKAEAKLQGQNAQLQEKDHRINNLLTQVNVEKEQTKTFEDLHKSTESNKAHLQNQILQKDSEINRLSHHLKKLEEEMNANSLEVEHFQGLLSVTRDKSIKDKDALKKATRIQRERAQRLEEINDEMQNQISKLNRELEISRNNVLELTEKQHKLNQDRNILDDEVVKLSKNIIEIGNLIEISQKSLKAGPLHVSEKLSSKIRHLIGVNVENENLKNEVKVLEKNLQNVESNLSIKGKAYESELSQQRSAIQQYESLVNEYKLQLERYRKESENLSAKLREQEDDTQRKVEDSMKEVSQVRTTLESKIVELEPYPELLRTSEIRLQDALERIRVAEKKATEHTRLIAELSQKVEFQMEQLAHAQDQYRNKADECKQLGRQLETIKRKYEDTEVTHKELLRSISVKDDDLQKYQQQLYEQNLENEKLIQQLEIALNDARKQADSQKEKAIAKERTAQARIMDLESQLSRSTQNTQILKKSKEEAERKFNSRLQDMRDRLEQANNTTRTMQSYVQFLKSTYANVFSSDLDT